MRTRLIASAWLLAASAAYGAPSGRVWRIGILTPSTRPDIYDAFTQGLKDLGYVEGRNVQFVWKLAGDDYARLPQLAEELVRLPVDVIIADATPALAAAEKATRTIPIVFEVGDPVGAGLIESLAHPGGNATGIAAMISDLVPKDLELLRRFVPALTRAAVLMNPQNSSHRRIFDMARAAHARNDPVTVLAFEAGSEAELPTAFDAMVREHVGGVIWIADPVFNAHRSGIATAALSRRLPSMSTNWGYAEAGGLLAYGAPPEELWRHLASYVDRVLRGENPATLPVEQPTNLRLIINRRTATALGLTIPPELLVQAERVIE